MSRVVALRRPSARQPEGPFLRCCGPVLLAASSSLDDPPATLAVHCGNGFDARFKPYQSTLEPIQCRPLGADMRRREFIRLLGSAATLPLVARAQQSGPMRRVGVLMNSVATETAPQSYVAAFLQALQQSGWAEGQNLRVDVRWNAGDAALARIYAAF
jgi:hypothetical protein